MEKVRIGIVGTGGIGNAHLGAYRNVKDVQIVAACDINEERLNETCDKFGIEKRYLSITKMLANEELDAADVCVWNCNHAKCTIEALNAGLHVLCEKPMAYNAKEAVEMKAAAEKNGKILMIGFVTRFSDEAKVAKDLIDNGYLGEIYYAKAQYIRRHGNPGGWFGDTARSGGGPVIDLGVHVIDRARYLMGGHKPVSVYAATFSKLGEDRKALKTTVGWSPRNASPDDVCDVEDFGTALIRFDNGSVVQLETAYAVNDVPKSGLMLCGDKGGLKTGDGPLVLYSNINGYMADSVLDTAHLKNGGEQFTREMQHFADCVLGRCECNANAEDGVIVMKILDAIYESARTGHEVVISE